MLYIILILLVCLTVYAYVLFPLILRMFKGETVAFEKYSGDISVVLKANSYATLCEKIQNVIQSGYKSENMEIIAIVPFETEGDISDVPPEIPVKFIECTGKSNKDIYMSAVNAAVNKIIVVTDEAGVLEKDSLDNIVSAFSKPNVGVVSGIQKKISGNHSVFWKYENKIKNLESQIGCVSGVSKSLYAIRKELIPEIPEKIYDVDFFVSTHILLKGYKVLFNETSVVYESEEAKPASEEFKKHIVEGEAYCQVFKHFFMRELTGTKSFVYRSHRVAKWMVPFAMFCFYLANLYEMCNGRGVILFTLQNLFYIFVFMYGLIKEKIKNPRITNKLLSLIHYFISLNVAWFIGFLMQSIRRR